MSNEYNDPVKSCPVYKNEGCTHVDGYLCDYPSCDIVKKWYSQQEPLGAEFEKVLDDNRWELYEK